MYSTVHLPSVSRRSATYYSPLTVVSPKPIYGGSPIHQYVNQPLESYYQIINTPFGGRGRLLVDQEQSVKDRTKKDTVSRQHRRDIEAYAEDKGEANTYMETASTSNRLQNDLILQSTLDKPIGLSTVPSTKKATTIHSTSDQGYRLNRQTQTSTSNTTEPSCREKTRTNRPDTRVLATVSRKRKRVTLFDN